MRTLRIFVLFLFSLPQFVQAQLTLTQVRESYFSRVDHGCKALEVSKKFDKHPPTDVVLTAYHGASLAAAAACVGNPMDKLKYFRRGKQLIEEAVMKQPNELEIRFLRFATQTKAPSFLGYTANIDVDRQFILKQLSNCHRAKENAEISRHISEFMLESGQLTAKESAELNKTIKIKNAER